MRRLLSCRYSQQAFLFSVPIGGLAGLIGLGGGEFRLPVLTQFIGYPPRAAIPVNLLISLVTLAFALVFRNHAIPAASVVPHAPEIFGLMLGGVASAFYSTRLLVRLSEQRLTSLMAGLLAAIGILLLLEALVPFASHVLSGEPASFRAFAGVAVGIAVGIVSSVLGVAGGELLIPALIFLFGADIRVAGTASLFISLAIVATGLWRYQRAGALPMTSSSIRIASSMSAGSLIGAALGGFVVAFAPIVLLKILLGSVLLVAAAKTISQKKR